MKRHRYFAITALVALTAGGIAYADDTAPPAQPPRTHIDTTVVGDAITPGTAERADESLGDNDHHFEAGEPQLVAMLKPLNLSAHQQAQLHDIIENFDAGAASLIGREHDVRDMLAATTPQDPLYAKLLAQQGTAAEQWKAGREKLRQDVMAILTPAQQTRFAELEARRQDSAAVSTAH